MKKKARFILSILIICVLTFFPITNLLANWNLEDTGYNKLEEETLNMSPLEAAVPSQQAETATYTITFEKLTNVTDFESGGNYLITVPGQDIALTANLENTTHAVSFTPSNSTENTMTISGLDPTNVGEIFSFTINTENEKTPEDYISETSVTGLSIQSGGVYLRFGASQASASQATLMSETSAINLVIDVNENGTWYIHRPGTSTMLTLAYTDQGFLPQNISVDNRNTQNQFNIWKVTNSVKNTTYTEFFRFQDLSNLNSVENFVMTIPEISVVDGEVQFGNYDSYAIGFPYTGTNWRIPTNNLDYFKVEPGISIDVANDVIGSTNLFSVVFNKPNLVILENGEPDTNNVSYWKFTGISTTNGRWWWRPLNLPDSLPFSDKQGTNTVRFQYMTDSNGELQIYLRGNANASWLAYSPEGDFVPAGPDGSYEKSSGEIGTATLVPIRIYASVGDDPITVNYYDVPTEIDGDTVTANLNSSIQTQNYFGLPWLPDTNYGNYLYTQLGWTVNPKQSGYLDLDLSVNLYDYDDLLDTGAYSPGVKEKYNLIGTGNPDGIQSAAADILITEYAEEYGWGDNEINLYPIYAVRGFDTAISAVTDSGEHIVGISDWKPLQPEGSNYNNSEREKWLGSININVIRDGEPWAQSQVMYFSYHNDDAADLNIKFIPEDIDAGDPEALYSFMSYIGDEGPIYGVDENGQEVVTGYKVPYDDPEVFPQYDPVGHYQLDAAYAIQGGSEDGLIYAYNWMTTFGGQLDNVIGGTDVNVYVTSIYNVEYYLINGQYGVIPKELPKPISGSEWQNNKVYATTGTATAFNEAAENAAEEAEQDDTSYYPVTDDDYNQLLNPEEISEDGLFKFKSDEMLRGGSNYFTYFLTPYVNTIGLAPSPKSQVPQGGTLASGSQNNWLLVNPENSTLEAKNYQYNGNLSLNDLKGYLDGITAYATPSGNFAGTDPYTFHMFAFYNQGNSTPNNPPVSPGTPDTPNQPDTPDEPDSPNEPDTPDKPDTPNEPDTPNQPDTPNEPETPNQPETPSQPEVEQPNSVPSTPESTIQTVTVNKTTISSAPETGVDDNIGVWIVIITLALLGWIVFKKKVHS